MSLFNFFKPRKQKSALEVLMENPVFQQQKAIYDVMNKACAKGSDGDELLNGHGEFGLAPTNPIPTNTVMGSNIYLSRLLTDDGKKVESKRRYPIISEVSEMPIDVYDLSLPDGTPLGTIYISPYQKRTSAKAPRGFRQLFSASD